MKKSVFILFFFAMSSFFPASRVAASGQTPENESQFHLLIFSQTAGFRHDSIPAGIKAIEKLGSENRFSVEKTEDPNQFTFENLSRFDLLVFLSTSGEFFDENQKAAFQKFIQNGGGFVGIHAASTTEYGWDWYRRLIGAQFSRHPKVQEAVLIVENRNHPSTKHLPDRWKRTDEWYDFRTNPRKDVEVLLSIDVDSMTGSEMKTDHPIAWCKEFDGGRSWYTALGHTDESYRETAFLQHLLGGIFWAANKKLASPAKEN